MRELQRLLLVIAGGLFVLGLVYGFAVPAPEGCGTAFSGPDDLFDEADCEAIRGPLRGTPILLIGLAVIAAAGAAVSGPSEAPTGQASGGHRQDPA